MTDTIYLVRPARAPLATSLLTGFATDRREIEQIVLNHWRTHLDIDHDTIQACFCPRARTVTVHGHHLDLPIVYDILEIDRVKNEDVL